MKRRFNNNRSIKSRILREVMREVTPILEHDWTSAEASRMTDVYRDLHMSNNANRWKKYADEYKEQEQAREYDEVIDVKSTVSFLNNKKRFILAVYIPAKMNILMYFGNNNKMAVVRLTPDGPKEIFWKDIVQSIASLYKRGHIDSSNCNSVSKSLKKHKTEAKELCNEIKRVFGYDFSWRFFCATGTAKTVRTVQVDKVFNAIEIKNKIWDDEKRYDHRERGDVDKEHPERYARAVFNREFFIYIMRNMAVDQKNSSYFIYLGNKRIGMMFRVKAYRNNCEFYHSLKPGPAWKYMEHFGFNKDFAKATKDTSNIDNLYDFFKTKSRSEVNKFFAYISKCLSTKLTFDDVELFYNSEHNNIVGGKKVDDEPELDLDPSGLVVISTISDGDETSNDDINAEDDILSGTGNDSNSEEDFV